MLSTVSSSQPTVPPRVPGRILRVNNVSKRLGLSERTVRYYAETRQIRAFKRGPKIWLFCEPDVIAFAIERDLPRVK